jgi:hypothetical protein
MHSVLSPWTLNHIAINRRVLRTQELDRAHN